MIYLLVQHHADYDGDPLKAIIAVRSKPAEALAEAIGDSVETEDFLILVECSTPDQTPGQARGEVVLHNGLILRTRGQLSESLKAEVLDQLNCN